MTRSTRVLFPKVGWPTFPDSSAITQFLWERCRDWQYLNPTSGTSIWEDPAGTDGSIYVAYEGEDIVELVIEPGGNASEVASELENRFGLLTEAISQDAG